MYNFDQPYQCYRTNTNVAQNDTKMAIAVSLEQKCIKNLVYLFYREPKQIIHRSSSPVHCIRAYKEGFIAGTGKK